MNHTAEKGELRTLVINSTNRINNSTLENAQYGVDWDNILGSGRYRLHWKYIEADIVIPPTPFQQLLISKPPWGQYNATNWVQGTLTLTDMTGNGRHGVGAGGITQTNSSGNGATASINSIGGTTTANVLWPTGSIPNPYTICSISRLATGTQNRVLQSETDNWLLGHHGTGAGGIKRGVHYNGSWKTLQVNTGIVTNWLNFCATSGNTNPNNVLLDGNGVGIASGSNGIVSKLAINIGPFPAEKSDWSLAQLIIWNQVLTPAEMVIVSNAYTNFLLTGILS